MTQPDHGLRRELRLRDLVLMQVVLIFSLGWTGFAAKQGSSQFLLWLIAIVVFYLPLAAVVMRLSRAMPMEGGLYQWARAGLSPFAGYMAAWSATTYVIVNFASMGSSLASGFAWAAGPAGKWMGDDKWFALMVTAVFCAASYFVNLRGLQVGKWLSATCSFLWIGITLVLFYLLASAWLRGIPSARGSVSFALPPFSLLTIGVLAKMAMGALSGFENSAVFAGECRKPENDVARSVLIAAPAIALMYILSTAALLAYTAPGGIDMAAPVQQAIHSGFGGGPLGTALTIATVAALSYAFLVSGVITVGMVARLPMVAGWDGLLPAWWSELHPVYRTPSKAIGAVCGAIMLFAVLSLWGAGNQEAVQALTGASVTSLCIMYMLLFGVVLFGVRSAPNRPGLPIRLGAGVAFVVALVSLILQIVPLGEVSSRLGFALKVTLVMVITNALGAWLYRAGERRLARSTGTA